MIEIEGKLISLDVFEKQFICNLEACKGACCVEGDSGAPLEDEETAILEKILPELLPYLGEEERQALEAQGAWVIDSDGDKVTPLVNGKHCAYVYWENGIVKCAIEKAFTEGKTDFPKPVSCHLYPIRIKKYRYFEAVNYDKWDICSPACTLGKALQVPVYKFLENALKRKYGAEWYEQVKEAAKLLGSE